MSAILSAAGDGLSWYEHGERSQPAASTVARLRPHFAALGITRLARQTALDRIGIPCFAAMRPAALTLSVTQGKGSDDASAMASALMEAAEYAVVERPQCAIRLATVTELEAEDQRLFNPRRLMPAGARMPMDRPLRWVAGESWPSGGRIWLPLDALTLGGDADDLPGVSRSSNGLASGNTRDEALFHALCELIERDATAIWSMLSDAARVASEFSPAIVADDVPARMCAQIAEAGLELRLFDQTTDLGVPCVMAVIWDRATDVPHRFDMAAGYGCHPVAGRAIARAVSEAAQTRVTNIAGARDDFLPAEYFEAPDGTTAFFARHETPQGRGPAWLAPGTGLPDLLGALAARVGDRCDIAWTELGGQPYGISVVRALSSVLEDREANSNWRPGRRALAALAGA